VPGVDDDDDGGLGLGLHAKKAVAVVKLFNKMVKDANPERRLLLPESLTFVGGWVSPCAVFPLWCFPPPVSGWGSVWVGLTPRLLSFDGSLE